MSYSELVSVIIPTYNRASLLLEALTSVYCQTYRPIEVIVVDDGSTDNTEEIVHNFTSKQSREDFQILYLHQDNKGPSTARNAGLKVASGKYIQFLDSDDLIHTHKIELHARALNQAPKIHCIFSDRQNFISSPNWTVFDPNAIETLRSESYFLSFNFLTNAGLYRRESCFLAGLWNESLNLGEDLEFNLKILGLSEWILYLKGYLAGCRQHSGPRLTTSVESELLREKKLALYRELAIAATKILTKNPKVFDSVATLYNCLALEFMLSGDRNGAIQTIESCRQMPLSQRRLRRLKYLSFLAHMPASWLQLLWKANEIRRIYLRPRGPVVIP